MIAAIAPITTPSVDWLAIAPELALGGAAVLVVLSRALLRRRSMATPVAYLLAAVGIVTTGAMLFWQWWHVADHGPIATMGGMVARRPLRVFLGVVVAMATAMAVLIAVVVPPTRTARGRPEYLALMLFSAVGMLAMTTANDLIVVFLALEILSIPLYVLAAFDRRRLSSQEAGIKYFVLGAFSSAIFLYGIALVYGATGTTSLTGIQRPSSRAMCCPSRARCWRGSRAAPGRPRLQGRGSPVPHVDARRLRGRADARSPRSWLRPPRPRDSRRCCGCSASRS